MDIKKLMQQAKVMQAKAEKIKGELKKRVYVGSSGAGACTVEVSGSYSVLHIKVDPQLFIPDAQGKVDFDVIEDLLKAALNAAFRKADEDAEASLKGANLPPEIASMI